MRDAINLHWVSKWVLQVNLWSSWIPNNLWQSAQLKMSSLIMFSFNNYNFIWRCFQYSWPDLLKVVCCRFPIWLSPKHPDHEVSQGSFYEMLYLKMCVRYHRLYRIEKSCKRCGLTRICSFRAFTSFVTVFWKIVCCTCVKIRLHVNTQILPWESERLTFRIWNVLKAS